MTTSNNSKDIILVNCLEIPETICVETVIIRQSGTKHPNEVFHNANNNTSDINRREDQMGLGLQVKPTGTIVPQSTDAVVPLITSMANINTKNVNNLSTGQSLNSTVSIPFNNSSSLNLNTPALPSTSMINSDILINENVRRSFCDNEQGTNRSEFYKSVGIQCELDVDYENYSVEWQAINEEAVEDPINSENERENFLKFVKDNSTQHANCTECLICGELCKSSKYFYGHMAIHRGPKVLCSKCGHNLDHENLLRKHKCWTAMQLEKAFLQCPHYKCSVKAISLLELYDHINEHANNRMYKCSACRKNFCTGQEFLRHLLIRAKCYTGAKRKRFRVYGLEPQKDRSCRVRVFTLHTFKKCTILVKAFLSRRVPKKGICQICLRSFSHKSVYKRHRVKCILKFKKRLKRKSLM